MDRIDELLSMLTKKAKKVLKTKGVVSVAVMTENRLKSETVVINPDLPFANEAEVSALEGYNPEVCLRDYIYFSSTGAIACLSESEDSSETPCGDDDDPVDCSFLLQPGVAVSVVADPWDPDLQTEILEAMRL